MVTDKSTKPAVDASVDSAARSNASVDFDAPAASDSSVAVDVLDAVKPATERNGTTAINAKTEITLTALDAPTEVDATSAVDASNNITSVIEIPTIEISDSDSDTSDSDEAPTKVVETAAISEARNRAFFLYCTGLDSYYLKSFGNAASDLSQACTLYKKVYGELADELAVPYLYYGKSLVGLALYGNKVVEVSDEEEDVKNDFSDEEEYGNEDEYKITQTLYRCLNFEAWIEQKPMPRARYGCHIINNRKSSTAYGAKRLNEKRAAACKGRKANIDQAKLKQAFKAIKSAADIFEWRGERGRQQLAEAHTELGTIQYESNQLDSSIAHYEIAISIYKISLPRYGLILADVYYKLGLAFLKKQEYIKSATALREVRKLVFNVLEGTTFMQDRYPIRRVIDELDEKKLQLEKEALKPIAHRGKVFAAAFTYRRIMQPRTPRSKAYAAASTSRPSIISRVRKRKIYEESSSDSDAGPCSSAKRRAV